MFEGDPPGLPTEAAVLDELLDVLKWGEIVEVIKSRRAVRRAYQSGGFVLKRPNKKRAHSVISKELENHSESAKDLQSALFMAWYQNHAKFRERLDKFFRSEDYQELVDSEGLDSKYYHLPEEKFEQFASGWDRMEAAFLLTFSPILFTESQVGQLAKIDRSPSTADTENSSSNAELKKARKRIKELENANRQLKRDVARKHSENRRLQSEISKVSDEIDGLAAEITDHRAQRDKVECEKQSLEEDLRSVRAEIGVLRRRIKDLDQERVKNVEQIASLKQLVGELQQEIERGSKDSAIDFLLADQARREAIFAEIGRVLDGVAPFRELLDAEVDAGGDELSLSRLWRSLCEKEYEKIERVSKITRADTTSGEFGERWSEIEDDFEDIEYLGQAKLALISAINQLFREVASGID